MDRLSTDRRRRRDDYLRRQERFVAVLLLAILAIGCILAFTL